MRQDMIEYVRQNLPLIFKGFGENLLNPKTQPTENSDIWVTAVKYWLEYEKKEQIRQMPFEFISDDEFKVVDVTPNRLAINTGSKILFNANRLSDMPQFTLNDAVQLLLHEYNHLMPDQLEIHDWRGIAIETVPWTQEKKDAFATAISSLCKKMTLSTTNSRQEATSILDLGEPSLAFRNVESHLKSMVRERFMIWTESDHYFEIEEEFYKNLHVDEPFVFFKSLNLSHANWTDKKKLEYTLVPKIEIISLTTNSKQEAVLEAHYYPRFLLGGSKLSMGYLQSNVTRTISKGERRFNFRVQQQNTSFRMTQQIDRDQSRFISIDVDGMAGLETQSALKRVVLLAQNSQGLKYSYPPVRIKKQMPGSRYKMIFQVPAELSLELTEVLVQSKNSDGFPVELSVRPTDSQKITSRGPEKERPPGRGPRLSHKLAVRFWESKESNFNLDVSNGEGIIGLTIESRVPLIFTEGLRKNGAYWGRGPMVTAEKKYFSKEQLKKYQDSKRSSQYSIPIWYKTYSTSALTKIESVNQIDDSHIRGVTGLWLHYADGEVIRLELPSEPTIQILDEVSQRFQQEKRKMIREKKATERFAVQPEIRSCGRIYH